MRKLIPLATYIYTLLIVVASLAKLAITFVPSGVHNSDKYAHAIAYLGFSIIWTLFFYVKNNEVSKNSYNQGILKAGAFSVVFGIAMEIAQFTFTDYRQFDMLDALANTLGALIGMFILYYFTNFFMLIKKRTR